MSDTPSADFTLLVATAESAIEERLHAALAAQRQRIDGELARFWQVDIEPLVEQQFQRLREGLAGAASAAVARQVADAAESAREAGRREWADQLNQAARRMRDAESREGFHAALLDAAALACPRVALLTLADGQLSLAGTRGGMSAEADPPHQPFPVPLRDAPAFASVVESRDTVICLKTAGELSPAVADLLQASGTGRLALLPILQGETVTAILAADSGSAKLDAAGLELVVMLASAAPPRAAAPPQAPTAEVPALIQIGGARPTAPEARTGPAWSMLSRDEQQRHLQAQRFARTQVANLILFHAEAVKAGRSARALYAALRQEIETVRQRFRQQFMTATPSMVDYYHLELVRTLANDDEPLLGPDYPGPMV